MRITVVGGGVVGLCCAFEFARAGADVSIIESGRCGEATSLRNAGQLVPSLSSPLSAPGVIPQALGWLLKRGSPLRIKPRLDANLARWLWRFARSSPQEQHFAGLKANLALGRSTGQHFDALRDSGVEFELHSQGLLFATLSGEVLEEDVRMLEDLQAAGFEGEFEAFDGDAARRFEPALSGAVAGGVHVKSERHVRPESLVRGLSSYLTDNLVKIFEGTEARGLHRDPQGVWRVSTSSGEIEADRVVVAAGVWSKRLLADLGVKLLLEGAKGYSVTSKGYGTRPQHPLKLVEAQVVCTPYDGATRVSGMFELSGLDLSLDQRRIEAVVSSASEYLKDWRPAEQRIEWAGLRPSTPDSLPLIGTVPQHDGLYVATGHGMLGVTLAPATGAMLAPLVLEDRLLPELVPFRLDRFW